MDIAITSGIIGGIAAAIAVSILAAKVRALPCPRCKVALNKKKPGRRTWTQVFWGG